MRDTERGQQSKIEDAVAIAKSVEGDVGASGQMAVAGDGGFDAVALERNDAFVLVGTGRMILPLAAEVGEIENSLVLPGRVEMDQPHLFGRWHMAHGAPRSDQEKQVAIVAAMQIRAERGQGIGVIQLAQELGLNVRDFLVAERVFQIASRVLGAMPHVAMEIVQDVVNTWSGGYHRALALQFLVCAVGEAQHGGVELFVQRAISGHHLKIISFRWDGRVQMKCSLPKKNGHRYASEHRRKETNQPRAQV